MASSGAAYEPRRQTSRRRSRPRLSSRSPSTSSCSTSPAWPRYWPHSCTRRHSTMAPPPTAANVKSPLQASAVMACLSCGWAEGCGGRVVSAGMSHACMHAERAGERAVAAAAGGGEWRVGPSSPEPLAARRAHLWAHQQQAQLLTIVDLRGRGGGGGGGLPSPACKLPRAPPACIPPAPATPCRRPPSRTTWRRAAAPQRAWSRPLGLRP